MGKNAATPCGITPFTYFGALIYKNTAITANNRLGIHTAITGGIFPFTAKVDEMVWKRINEKLSPNPIPRFNPIPPFTFLDESDKPIMVNIKEANEPAILR